MIKNDDIIRDFLTDIRYRVLPAGEIQRFSLSKNKWARCESLNSSGYLYFCWKKRNLKSHRVVYQAFCGELDSSLHVNHKDGNKANNNPSNLELVSCSENQKHKGGSARKLCFSDAEKIRSLWNKGAYTQKKLAEKYQVSTRLIELICANKRHVASGK